MNARVNPEDKGKQHVAFVESLPEINETNEFLVLREAEENLLQLWSEFIYITLETLNLYSEASYTKQIPEFLEGKIKMDELNYVIRTQLGMVDEIPVIHVEKTPEGHFAAEMNMDFHEMTRIYYERPKKATAKGYNARAILDRFFGYLWVKGMLLYPMRPPKGYQRPAMWKTILAASFLYLKQEASLFIMLKKRFEPMVDEFSGKRQYRLNAINNLLVSTRWRRPEEITEEGLQKLEKITREKMKERSAVLKFTKIVLNDLRYALIDSGRGDIRPPRKIANEGRRKQKPFPHFIPVKKDENPLILELMGKGEKYIDFLRHEGMSTGSIEGYASDMNTLFRYLLEVWPDVQKIDIQFVDGIYDPEKPDSLHEYIRKTGVGKKTYISKMKKISSFLDFCGLYSARSRKNTPSGTGKERSHPARRAMPAEMVRHIHDILLHRPPNSPTRWLRKRADISWWPHDVWPVYPILFLFLYSIPLRGGQARHLCRERSFVLSKDGKRLEKFIINTDKNVHRGELLEIPCAWDDLQIFVPFLKWHREYFPHLEKISYNDDENSPWEDIEPLMILPDEPTVMSKGSMMDYHKRLLCRYQLEKMKEAEERGDDDYPVVAWSKTGRPFFKSVEELDLASKTRIKDIQVAYDIHSLRVTGATRYMEAGLGIPHLMMLTGHTTPDVLLSIYVRLTDEERRRELRSAIRKIGFGNRETAIESGKTFIREELVEAYRSGPERMRKALEDNGLFSLERKGSSREGKTGSLPLGTELAEEMHPTTWRPMVHGICPGAKCPDGRENRCSLCPHFITGKLFVDGLVLMTNQLLARFQRRTLQIMEEREKGYTSPARAEEQEMVLEEILGYHEILERIERGFASGESGDAALPVPSGGKRILTEKIPETMAYLRNEWEAGLFGVERDRYGMKLLTVEAMKVAASSGDAGMAGELADSPEKAIDYLMNHYSRKPGEIRGGVDVCEFVRKIGYRPMERSEG